MPPLLAIGSSNAIKANFSGGQGRFRKRQAHLNFLLFFAMRQSSCTRRDLLLLLFWVIYFEWRKVILKEKSDPGGLRNCLNKNRVLKSMKNVN